MADRFCPVPPPADDDRRGGGRNLFWFAAIALSSLCAVAAIAYGLRAILRAAGG
jgi:hypothetical protein